MSRFPFRLIAAPMAGISSRAFREIVRSCGADLAYGEMISARALGYGNKKTWELMDIEGEDSPRLVQISGCDPDFVAAAAMEAAGLGAELIDLNMGCPVPKVVKNNEGCMLMSQPELACSLVKAASSCGLPISCKIRLGWDDEHRNGIEFAQALEGAGASFIAVHGRTRQQFYSGRADWDMIARIKDAVSIPVIGNGDITDVDSALSMFRETGCDGIMIGRGMLGNPWLFQQIAAALSGKEIPSHPEEEIVVETALTHLRRQVERSVYWMQKREGESEKVKKLAEELAVRGMRNHLGWYVKGMRNASKLRLRINQALTVEEVTDLLQNRDMLG